MNDLDTLDDAKRAALTVYRLAVDKYQTRTVIESSDTEWDGEALALWHLDLLEQVTAKYPESIALAARRAAIDQFIEAHLGAEFDSTDHEDTMRRKRP